MTDKVFDLLIGPCAPGKNFRRACVPTWDGSRVKSYYKSWNKAKKRQDAPDVIFHDLRRMGGHQTTSPAEACAEAIMQMTATAIGPCSTANIVSPPR